MLSTGSRQCPDRPSMTRPSSTCVEEGSLLLFTFYLVDVSKIIMHKWEKAMTSHRMPVVHSAVTYVNSDSERQYIFGHNHVLYLGTT